MARANGRGGDVATGIQAILERIGEFFHLFDLSFFVSGAVTSAALACLYLQFWPLPAVQVADWIVVGAVIVACYTAGLMSFAIGRLINGRLLRRRQFPRRFQEALMRHEVRSPEIVKYLDPPDYLWWLYIRLWQDMVMRHPRSVALAHLSRYWVMAATYDGLATSFLTWAVVSIAGSSSAAARHPVPWAWGVLAAVGFVALAVTALRQGAAYYAYQIDDLVAATLAARSSVL